MSRRRIALASVAAAVFCSLPVSTLAQQEVLNGEWRVERIEPRQASGNGWPDEPFLAHLRFQFEGNRLTVDMPLPGPSPTHEVVIDRTQSPHAIDFIRRSDQGDVLHITKAIFEFKDDALRLCMPVDSATSRPVEFKAADDGKVILLALKRAAENDSRRTQQLQESKRPIVP
jgi:uncharacterized protein (TIGR03067 family)